ncbi:MAG TPA: hypothetical protein VFW09_20565, partial [Solirubrobacteraceae bacterium]|nr:hypothetical protein [Solirubrobacteraceae bacterium]
LCIGVLAWIFRTVVQDRKRLALREATPTTPDAETATAFEAMGVGVGTPAGDRLGPITAS